MSSRHTPRRRAWPRTTSGSSSRVTAVRRLFLIMLCALVVAPAAAAMVVPQRGIAGVRLHMTKSQVRALLGAPRHVQTGRNDFGRYTTFRYPRVSVTFQSGVKV